MDAPISRYPLPELRDQMSAHNRGLKRSLVMATGAFLIYGGWAAYANWEYGLATALVSTITQGTLSFLITVFLTLVLEFIFHRIDSRITRFISTILGAQLVAASMTFMIHYLVGTPEILITMAPSFVVSSLYCTMYTIGLHMRYS